MRTRFTLLSLVLCFSVPVFSQDVVPPAYAGSAGGNSFIGPLATSARTYQLLINQNQLTQIVGKEINAIAWRVPAGGTGSWPAADATATNYEILLAPGVAPASRSLAAFADNAAGPQVTVRSGPLNIATGTYSLGSTPNAFGPFINFNSRYIYTGGHLLVEIRHTGMVGSTSRSVDALGTSTSGYGTDFSACWQGTGSILQGNFGIIAFQTSDIPTPLSLLSFSGKLLPAGADLQWSTANEKNTDRFEVERSNDALQFTLAGSVAASGNSGNGITYRYTDNNALAEHAPVIYYRLKMIDKDGKFTYSQLIKLKVNGRTEIASLYPNPTKNTATLSINTDEAGEVSYTIIDHSGKKLKTGTYEMKRGSNTFTVPTGNLISGNYTLLLQGKTIRQQLPFIKQ